MSETWQDALTEAFEKAENKVEFSNTVREWLHENHAPVRMPIDLVRWVPASEVFSNDYNPNSVAPPEMALLHRSISADGFTQPIVAVWDTDSDRYVIVDGFHRFRVGTETEVCETTGGYLPIVVIATDKAGRMASTVRHNRARGRHAAVGMSALVMEMLLAGKSDTDICVELGMDANELVRLKNVTGFAKLYEDVKYSPAWVPAKDVQVELARQRREL